MVTRNSDIITIDIDTMDMDDMDDYIIDTSTSVWDQSIMAHSSPGTITITDQHSPLVVTSSTGAKYDVVNVFEELMDKVEVLTEELERRGIRLDMTRRLDEKRMLKKLSGDRE